MSNDISRIEFCCIGGPWDRQVLLLGGSGTLPFTLVMPDTARRVGRVWAGRYVPSANRNHRVGLNAGGKKYPIVEWEPAPTRSQNGWFQ